MAAPGLDRVQVVRVVLVVVATLCLAAAFGPVWLARAGILLALLAGGGAAWFVSQLISAQRRANVHELRELRRDHRASFTAERSHNGGVVDELTSRVTNAQGQVRVQQDRLGELGAAVAALRTDKKALAKALIGRDETIATLNVSLAARTADATRLREELATEIAAREQAEVTVQVEAEVHGLPRRRTVDEQPQATAASF